MPRNARYQALLEGKVSADPEATFESNRLCQTCERACSSDEVREGLLGGGSEPHVDMPHYQTVEEIEESATQGCHLCSHICEWLVLDELRDTAAVRPERPNEHPTNCHCKSRKSDRLFLCFKKTGAAWYATYSINVGRVGPEGGPCSCAYTSGDLWVVQEPGEDDSLKHLKQPDNWNWVYPELSHDRYSLSSRSDFSFRLIKSWMDACVQEHGSCRNYTYGIVDFLPSRLLHLRDPPTGTIVSLCDIDDLRDSAGQIPPYVALSHRWRAGVICMTEKTLLAFKSSIPISSMSVTFQQAIEITLRLGFSYIWIDSLCIIQDSRSDWAVESAKMGAIYRGSICSIAAVDSDNCGEGFFTVRNPLKTQHCLMCPKWEHGTRPMIQGYRGHRGAKLEGELLSRGWVVQERALSVRTIYFDATGIWWECSSHLGDDWRYQTPMLYPNDTDTRPQNEQMFLKATLLRAVHSIEEALRGTRSQDSWARPIPRDWYEIVEMYSARRLTMPGDKLVAIHGIVREILRHIQQRCPNLTLTPCAGLWEEFLHHGLLWCVDKHTSHSPPYRAPSWSWASVDTAVHYPNLQSPKWFVKASLLDINTRVHGQVISGRLLLEGPMKRIAAPKLDKNWRYQPWADVVVLDTETDATQGTVEALLMGQESQGECLGLLLSPVVDQERVYKRIGYFRHRLNLEGDKLVPVADGHEFSRSMLGEMREIILI